MMPNNTKQTVADLGKQAGIFKRIPPRKIPDGG